MSTKNIKFEDNEHQLIQCFDMFKDNAFASVPICCCNK